MTDETPALHYSKGKLGIDQIPPEALLELGLVYSYGEFKYWRDNWKNGTRWSEFIGSAKRHLLAFEMGEDKDPESSCFHLAHLMWNAATLLYYTLYELGDDDREVGPYFEPDEENSEHSAMDYMRLRLAEVKERASSFIAAKEAMLEDVPS